jgi:hypothetical protein
MTVERDLRAMLRERVRDVDAVPAGLLDPPGVSDAPHRRARSGGWRWPAVAAALVVAAAGVIIAIRGGVGAAPRPAGPASPSPTPTVSPTEVDGALRPLTCTTQLPAAWQAVLARFDSAGGRVLTVAPDGTVLRDVVAHGGEKLVADTASGSRTLFQAPATQHGAPVRIGDAATDGTWVVFTVLFGQGGGQGPVQIDAVRLTGGTVQVIRPTTATDPTIVLGPVLYDEAVYWTQIDAGQGLTTGPLSRYELSSRKTSVLAQGQLSGPLAAGGGLYWDDGSRLVTYRAGTLPPGYTPTPSKAWGLFRDGDTYAWTDPTSTAALLWRPGLSAPAPLIPSGATVLGVVGRYLFWSGGVLDTSTGANARVPFAVTAVYAVDGKEVLAGADGALPLNVAGLPDLRC